MNSVDFNVVTSNVNFKGLTLRHKKPTKKYVAPVTRIINLNSNIRIKITSIKKSLKHIFEHLGFGEKMRNAGEEQTKTKKKSKVTKSIEYFRDMRSFEKNPAEYNHKEFENHMKKIFKA